LFFFFFMKTFFLYINVLLFEGLPLVTKLNALVGSYVNLEYPLPSGAKVKFLNDETTYLGTQLESETNIGFCYGVLANTDFILVCTYGEGGSDPKLIMYKKR
ncbi:MAG: DNA-binding protein, partial [Bacilli bacterium]|nr:DNA-binding protein [Bacilli bacterium]